MEKHEYVGDAGNECRYRPHATARVCRERKGHPIHDGVGGVSVTPVMAAAQIGEGIRRAFGMPEVHAHDTIPAVQAWDAYTAQVRDTIIRKSAGYGDAWQEQGYMGNLARVLSKSARLKNMCWKDGTWLDTGGEEAEVEQEQVQDTLVDLGALCAFLVANLEEGNRWGRT